jgi:hypothetical protein
MKRLLIRAVVLALPFLVLMSFVAVVDPFDCLGVSRLVSDKLKAQSAQPLHNPLWKLGQFERAPIPRLILGDSSMASINTDDIRAATGDEYFNFAYGGGTLAESIDTYWAAAAKLHLDAVYIGIGLINFNEYQNLDRVPEARAIAASPLRYLTNRVVLEAAFLTAYSALGGAVIDLGVPVMSRDAFWRFQIDESLPQLLREYRFPAASAARLREVAMDCRRNGTRLVIVIPPTEVELQAKVAALGRATDEARFKAFVATLAPVFDLNYPNAFTSDRRNFSDPFHTMTDRVVVEEVWGNRMTFSHRTGPLRTLDAEHPAVPGG